MKETHGLTARELHILTLLAEGGTCKEIAKDLSISHKTVEAHTTNLMGKLDIHKRAILVHYAVRHGLVQIPRRGK